MTIVRVRIRLAFALKYRVGVPAQDLYGFAPCQRRRRKPAGRHEALTREVYVFYRLGF